MRKICILLCVGILISSSSCTPVNNPETKDDQVAYEQYSEEIVELNDLQSFQVKDDHVQTNIYYKDVSGYIIPVIRQIPKQDGIAKSALSALIDNVENRLDLLDLGLTPVLPENTTFQLALKDNNILRVDFNKAILDFADLQEEQIAVQSIVYTLTEFDTVEGVQILIDNQITDELTFGTDVSEPITRNNINSLDNYVEGESIKRTFYSYNNSTNKYTYYIPITKNIPREDNNVEKVITETININKDLGAKIPEGFNVTNAVIEDEIVYITIDKEIDDEDEAFIHFMKVLCLTLWENQTVKSVKLIVENSEVENMQIKTFTIPQYANVY